MQATEERYSPTPLVTRLPSVASLALAGSLAGTVGHSVVTGILILVGVHGVCLATLHFVFGQPIERLLQYREYGEQ